MPVLALALAVLAGAPGGSSPGRLLLPEGVALETVEVRRGAERGAGQVFRRLERAGRLELVRGAVREVLEPRAEGHEHRWHFARPWPGHGPLEVRVRVWSPDAPTVTGEGLQLGSLRYERLRWVDGTGRSWPVELRWDDGLMVLRVEAQVLAETTWPAVLDPVVGAARSVGTLVETLVDRCAWPAMSHDGSNFLFVCAQDRIGGTRGVYGFRVTPAGDRLDPHGLLIGRTANPLEAPALAFGNGVYLVVWREVGPGSTWLAGVRLAPTGQVLDAAPVVLADGPGLELSHGVVFDGARFLLVWADDRAQAGVSQLYAGAVAASSTVPPARLAGDGTLVDVGSPRLRSPAATWTGTQLLVAWADRRDNTNWRVFAARLDGALGLSGPTVELENVATDAANVTVVVDGAVAWAAWDDRIASTTRRGVFAVQFPLGGVGSGTVVEVGDPAADRVNPRLVRRTSGVEVHFAQRSESDGRRARLLPDGSAAPAQRILDQHWAAQALAVAARGDDVFSTLSGDPWVSVRLESDAGVRTQLDHLHYGSNWQAAPALARSGDTVGLLWRDSERDRQTLRFSRLDATGAVLDPLGRLAALEYWMESAAMASASGGWLAIGSMSYQLRARQVAPDGTAVGTGPFVVSNRTMGEGIGVASDGTDFFVVFSDDRAVQYDQDLYFARVTASGQVLDPGGSPLVTRSGTQQRGKVAFDGTRYVVTWEDGESREARYGVVPPGGGVLSPAGGVRLGTGAATAPVVTANDGVALLAWVDRRAGAADLYFHLLPSTATPTAEPGRVLTDAPGAQQAVSLGSDGTDFFAVWEDRAGGPGQSDVRFARLKADGTLREAPLTIAATPQLQRQPAVVGVGPGKAIVAWTVVDEQPPSTTPRVRVTTVGLPVPNGAGCTGPADCESAFCVDGVCCDSPCGGGAADCQACSVSAGAPGDGACVVLAASTVCRAAASVCDLSERCDGTSGLCPADQLIADETRCGAGVCRGGQCLSTEPTDGGLPVEDSLEFVSTPPASASCAQPWTYTPEVRASGPVRYSARAVEGPLPSRLFVNPETGALFLRMTEAGPVRFDLVAATGSLAVSQRVELDVRCEPLGVGCGCGAGTPGAPILALLALLSRRRPRRPSSP